MAKNVIFLRRADYESGRHACLHNTQIRVLNVLRGESYHRSGEANEVWLDKLSQTVADRGADLETVSELVTAYVANEAPIVIHWKPASIAAFASDTHYRSLFEIDTSNGSNCKSARSKHESDAFLNLYNGVTPFERPKYGALNVFGDPLGVRAAHGYGTCHFVLAPHVRKRCTINVGDTFGQKNLGTIDFCKHVLATLTNAEIKALVDAAVGAPAQTVNIPTPTYREVQIHGELRFDTDFAQCVVDRAHDSDAIRDFASANGIPVTVVDIGK